MADLFQSIAVIEDNEFNYLKGIIYERTGIALAPHKKIMLQSRLNSRLRVLGMSTYKDYVQKLKSEKVFFNTEIDEIINKVTTNKTDFFRENHHFEFLKNTVFPVLEERSKKTYKKNIRIWSSACSTGEEPYSIAMTVLDYFSTRPGWDIKIVASDIDTNVLKTAEKGIYKDDRLAPVEKSTVMKYFTSSKENDGTYYTVRQPLRDLIQFKKINLLETGYPFTEKFDVIFCRNVIIYFDKETQKKIFAGFERVIHEDGFLIIGHSETLFGISENFKFLGHTIYQKRTSK